MSRDYKQIVKKFQLNGYTNDQIRQYASQVGETEGYEKALQELNAETQPTQPTQQVVTQPTQQAYTQPAQQVVQQPTEPLIMDFESPAYQEAIKFLANNNGDERLLKQQYEAQGNPELYKSFVSSRVLANWNPLTTKTEGVSSTVMRESKKRLSKDLQLRAKLSKEEADKIADKYWNIRGGYVEQNSAWDSIVRQAKSDGLGAMKLVNTLTGLVGWEIWNPEELDNSINELENEERLKEANTGYTLGIEDFINPLNAATVISAPVGLATKTGVLANMGINAITAAIDTYGRSGTNKDAAANAAISSSIPLFLKGATYIVDKLFPPVTLHSNVVEQAFKSKDDFLKASADEYEKKIKAAELLDKLEITPDLAMFAGKGTTEANRANVYELIKTFLGQGGKIYKDNEKFARVFDSEIKELTQIDGQVLTREVVGAVLDNVRASVNDAVAVKKLLFEKLYNKNREFQSALKMNGIEYRDFMYKTISDWYNKNQYTTNIALDEIQDILEPFAIPTPHYTTPQINLKNEPRTGKDIEAVIQKFFRQDGQYKAAYYQLGKHILGELNEKLGETAKTLRNTADEAYSEFSSAKGVDDLYMLFSKAEDKTGDIASEFTKVITDLDGSNFSTALKSIDTYAERFSTLRDKAKEFGIKITEDEDNQIQQVIKNTEAFKAKIVKLKLNNISDNYREAAQKLMESRKIDIEKNIDNLKDVRKQLDEILESPTIINEMNKIADMSKTKYFKEKTFGEALQLITTSADALLTKTALLSNKGVFSTTLLHAAKAISLNLIDTLRAVATYVAYPKGKRIYKVLDNQMNIIKNGENRFNQLLQKSHLGTRLLNTRFIEKNYNLEQNQED